MMLGAGGGAVRRRPASGRAAASTGRRGHRPVSPRRGGRRLRDARPGRRFRAAAAGDGPLDSRRRGYAAAEGGAAGGGACHGGARRQPAGGCGEARGGKGVRGRFAAASRGTERGGGRARAHCLWRRGACGGQAGAPPPVRRRGARRLPRRGVPAARLGRSRGRRRARRPAPRLDERRGVPAAAPAGGGGRVAPPRRRPAMQYFLGREVPAGQWQRAAAPSPLCGRDGCGPHIRGAM